MMKRHLLLLLLALIAAAITAVARAESPRAAANERLLQQLQREHRLSDEQLERVRAVFAQSAFIGQGNPAISEHPRTPGQCRDELQQRSIVYDNPRFTSICGARFMAPLYDPSATSAESAQSCIDQFEFPNIPCEYPVVWVRAREAAQICDAIGKRLCDAHEWEGACAGRLEPPDYRFDLLSGLAAGEALRRMRTVHNRERGAEKSWAYGPEYRRGICGTGSRKTPGCAGGGWNACGSNTYPAGEFPDCRSTLDVYDLHGNAAEHMSLPLNEAQMSSRGSRELGYTEMKGSWFIFDSYRAHEDWCRWRAPFWHGTRVMDRNSHANYHLGFRCCKTVGGK